MKDLLITIYGGGDAAVEAAMRLVDIWRWTPIEDRPPPEMSRVIVARTVPSGSTYVDIVAWVPGSVSGLPPLQPNARFVTHWMPLPDAP